MITIPESQAIKFLPEGEANFNNSDICGCNTDEQWNYKVTAGDDICFQLNATCEESSDLVLNGSFEEAGETSSDFADWTRFNDNESTSNSSNFLLESTTRADDAVRTPGV